MRVVYFIISGRFANNLFQYFASEIIKKIYNYNEVRIYEGHQDDFNIVDNEKFRLITSYNKYHLCDTSKDILMNGYFQRSEIFLEFKEYLLSIFNTNNLNRINHQFTIKEIVEYNSKHIIPNDKDIVMHIRLDDFRGDNQIFDAEQLKSIIKNITFDKLYIVCDKIKQQWELDYLNQFRELSPIFISGSLLDDFKLLMNSKRLILSASTFAWMASFLNQNITEVHIPYNTFHGDIQNLGASSIENCKIYTDMKYMKF